MTSPTKDIDIVSFAQRIIINKNAKLRAKNKELKDKLSKSVNITEFESPIDKLTVENFQLKIENDKLKSDLSAKINDYNQLQNTLSNKTKNILNASKSLEKYSQKLSLMIKKIMENHEYEKLLSHKFFDAEYLFSHIYVAIKNNMKMEIMKHIIDNCLDLNVEVDAGYDFISTRLIHLFCKYANPELIQYLIDKGVELECPNKDGYYPLHLICRCSTPSMIKYIIAKGVDIKSNPKIDLIEIINQRSLFTADEKKELLALIE